MLKLNTLAGPQLAELNDSDAGESCVLFFSQKSDATARWRVDVEAITDSCTIQIGTFYISPPTATTPHGTLTRMVAAFVCPGAVSWKCTLVAVQDGETPVPSESASVSLSSSRGFMGPPGITRVGERYVYFADLTGTYTVRPGQRVISWTAVSDGSVAVVTISGGLNITIPAGDAVNGYPDGAEMPPGTVFAYSNAYFFIELAESA